MGYVSLRFVPFDNTKVRQVFDTTKYFSKIISAYLLFLLYIERYGSCVDLHIYAIMDIIAIYLYLCR